VRDKDGHSCIAKFPNRGDEYDAVRWEALALILEGKAGLTSSQWRLETAGERPVLILRRFVRSNGMRLPFHSASSMLGAR